MAFMEYLTIPISFIAGFGLGVSIVLYFWLKIAIIESRLWANKAVVREGQAKIFPSAMTDAGAADPPPNQPFQTQSVFRKGLSNLKGKVTGERQAQPLPEEVQNKIKEKFGQNGG